jgi:hypothetical protein
MLSWPSLPGCTCHDLYNQTSQRPWQLDSSLQLDLLTGVGLLCTPHPSDLLTGFQLGIGTCHLELPVNLHLVALQGLSPSTPGGKDSSIHEFG